jgi:hypothetical protein
MDNTQIKSKKRNLIYLLSSIIKLIPENSDENQFKEDLVKVRDKASYTDPDMMYFIWEEAQLVITNKFKNMEIMPDWCVEFINVWTNKIEL